MVSPVMDAAAQPLTLLVDHQQSAGQASWESLICYEVPGKGGKSELESAHL